MARTPPLLAFALAFALALVPACATAGADGDIDASTSAADASGVDGSPDASALEDFLISEFVFNHLSNDTSEFIEVIGPPNTSASTHTIIVIEGDIGAVAGTLYFAEPLGTTNAAGLHATAFFSDGLQNGSQTLLLVTGLTASVGTDLDTNDDGVLDSEPWTAIVDGVSITDGDAGDLVYATPTLPPDYDGGALSVGGSSRIPNTADTGTAADWVRNDFDGEGLPCCASAIAATGEAINTPGAGNQVK